MASTGPVEALTAKTAKEIEDALAMPPPPPPVRSVVLEAEVNALHAALKLIDYQNAVAQTGLVYKFHKIANESGVRNAQPPQSLTWSAWPRDRKLRAISVLQRDLAKEQEKKRKEEEEEAARLAEKQREIATTPEPMQEDESTQQTQPTTQNNSPISATHPTRRPSVISYSSLHRPAFPHKLDLSSVSFRLPSEDNSIIQSGLASPVTLAPKSARALGANELPPDFLSSFASSSSDSGNRPPDIDLTIPDDILPANGPVDLTAGGSSDKPIELDLDDDLDVAAMFGGSSGANANPDPAMQSSENIFSEGMGAAESTAASAMKDTDFFKQFEGNEELFSNLEQQGESSKGSDPQPEIAPGPMLDSFGTSTENAVTELGNIGDQAFDFNTIDLTNLDSSFNFPNQDQPNPELAFPVDFTMGDASESKEAGSSNA
ncbi:hypothetical protein DFP72DRAFT_838920 [Ephemerocybe angulata]|uniref:Uncharacterized protein n=1 Tax=Ephemerocybe angulata TaxID=980116 RepID=A0A8H6MHW9_9AGAR|nr:hypothetical protein DFP72DRAFT_838920 [Tulosesus angulatus]